MARIHLAMGFHHIISTLAILIQTTLALQWHGFALHNVRYLMLPIAKREYKKGKLQFGLKLNNLKKMRFILLQA